MSNLSPGPLGPLLNIGPPPFNMPYGPVGVPPSDDSNPANHGFAPAAGYNSGQPILDMIVNTLLKGAMGNAPMLRTMSRPQVSDYAYTAMQERRGVSEAAAPAIAASNPFLRSLGILGQSPLVQQALDSSLSPGGGMNDAFNVILGRFGSDLAGPGSRNASTAAVMAANVLKNVDEGLVDENGIYDYEKTSGFNRAETFQNLAAFNKQFGGFGARDNLSEGDKTSMMADVVQEVMTRPNFGKDGPTRESAIQIDQVRNEVDTLVDSLNKKGEGELKGPELQTAKERLREITKKYGNESDLANLDAAEKAKGGPLGDLALPKTEKNKDKIKAAQDQIKELNEMTRELQNLFGPEKGVGELMQSLNKMVAGTSNMTAGKAKALLQKIQATAVTVDMSNESIVRYFEMMDNLYKGMGVRGNTTERAQQDLLSGQSIVNARKAKLEPGQIYTGESAVEMAQQVTKMRTDVDNSAVNRLTDSYILGASDEGEAGAIKKQVIELKKQGRNKEAAELAQQQMEKDEKTSRDVMAKYESMDRNGGKTKRDQQRLDKLGVGSTSPGAAIRQHAEQAADLLLEDGTETSQVTSANDKEILREAIRSGALNSDTINDPEKFAKVMSQKGMSSGSINATYYAIQKDKTKSASFEALIDTSLMPEETAKEQDRLNAIQEENKKDVESAAKRSPYLRNLGAGDAVTLMARVHENLKKRNIDTSKLTIEDYLKAGGEETKRFLGVLQSDPNSKEAQQLKTQWEIATGKSPEFESKMKLAEEAAHKEAQAYAESWDKTGTNTDPGVREQKLKEVEKSILTEKQKEVLKEYGMTPSNPGEPGSGETSGEKPAYDPTVVLKPVLDVLERIATGVNTDRRNATPTGNPGSTPENPGIPSDTNPNIPAPQTR